MWAADANEDLISIWQYGVEEWSQEIAERICLKSSTYAVGLLRCRR
jgi:hypothetical protein